MDGPVSACGCHLNSERLWAECAEGNRLWSELMAAIDRIAPNREVDQLRAAWMAHREAATAALSGKGASNAA
jgi:hypothetical protein